MFERPIGVNIEHCDSVAVTVHGKQPLIVRADDDGRIVVIWAEFPVGGIVDPCAAGQEWPGGVGRQRAVAVALIGDNRIRSLGDVVALKIQVVPCGEGGGDATGAHEQNG